MNRENIIRMAREAGLHAPEGRTYILSPTIHPDDDLSEYLERFANAVASAEREACAQICEEYETNNDIAETWLNIVSEVIRARGQA